MCWGVCVGACTCVCGDGGAGICVSIVQASNLPRGNPVQTPLFPGNLPPVCRKHILHGWLNWIIITGCIFGKRGKKKPINVIYPHSNPPPMKSPPPKSLQHANPMNCDTPQFWGKQDGEKKAEGGVGRRRGYRDCISRMKTGGEEPRWR